MELKKYANLSLRKDIKFVKTEANEIQVQSPYYLSPPVPFSTGGIAAVERLADGGGTENELSDMVFEDDGFDGLVMFTQFLCSLESAGYISYGLHLKKRIAVLMIPSTPDFIFESLDIDEEQSYTLSPFCYFRKEDEKFILESPLSFVKTEVFDLSAMQVISSFFLPINIRMLSDKFHDFSNTETECLVCFLLLAKLLIIHEGKKAKHVTALDHWDFHDLLFHSRSRMGRHNNPFGGTYRFDDSVEKLLAVKPEMKGKKIPLQVPDLNSIMKNDISFSRAVEERKSVRNYGKTPLTLGQLGEFLYRVAHIKYVAVTQDGYEVCGRPGPSGGSINELEIYVVVNNCKGLQSGVYHYASQAHRLAQISKKNALVDELLNLAWITATQQSDIQVLLVITARFQRLSYKYQSIAYSLVLKHVGILFQNMYLTATSMKLAPCALGGGNADLFCKITGLDYYKESPVGEFILGSVP